MNRNSLLIAYVQSAEAHFCNHTGTALNEYTEKQSVYKQDLQALGFCAYA